MEHDDREGNYSETTFYSSHIPTKKNVVTQ